MALVHALAYGVIEPACGVCGVGSIIAEAVVRAGSIEGLCSARAETHVPELLYEGEARVPRFYDDLHRIPTEDR